jgi:hypothetical protein
MVELGTVFVTLDSGRRIKVDMITQIMVTVPMTLAEINEVNRKLAEWQVEHQLLPWKT